MLTSASIVRQYEFDLDELKNTLGISESEKISTSFIVNSNNTLHINTVEDK